MPRSIYAIRKKYELKKQALKLYKKGLTMEEIAPQVGKSRQWVGLAINELLGEKAKEVIR